MSSDAPPVPAQQDSKDAPLTGTDDHRAASSTDLSKLPSEDASICDSEADAEQNYIFERLSALYFQQPNAMPDLSGDLPSLSEDTSKDVEKQLAALSGTDRAILESIGLNFASLQRAESRTEQLSKITRILLHFPTFLGQGKSDPLSSPPPSCILPGPMRAFTENLDKKIAAVAKTLLGAIRPLEAVYGLCSASVLDKRSYLDLVECRNTTFLTLTALQEAAKALSGVRRSLWRPLLAPNATSDLPPDCIIGKDEAVALRDQAVKKAETKRADPARVESLDTIKNCSSEKKGSALNSLIHQGLSKQHRTTCTRSHRQRPYLLGKTSTKQNLGPPKQ
ncbi:hypothetical protein PAPYR_12252 [Paratrimastix pyriformis]|uniref:Uncharacterized protein n=1 Tax=Paratrimastix pyriformis TaxID=342808 RepID=A0ABQ8U270_9EUKA|nr:hypothetical protein PAPYR_12252 [Paratrimastix pyriformis]